MAELKEKPDKVTSIHIHRSTVERLRRLKVHERETDEDIIKRLMNEKANTKLIVGS